MIFSFQRFVYCLLFVFFTGIPFSSSLVGQQISVEEIAVRQGDVELPGMPVVRLMEDTDGFVWASLFGHGIGRYDGNKLKQFTATEGVSSGIWSMQEDQKGYLWLGGTPLNGLPGQVLVSSAPITGGLLPSDLHFRDSVGTTALTSGATRSIRIDDHGQIWAATDSVLSVYAWREDGGLDNMEVARRGQGRFPDQVLFLLPGRNGTMWLSFVTIPRVYQLKVTPGTTRMEVLDSIAIPQEGGLQLRMVDFKGRLWGHYNTSDYYCIDPATRNVKNYPCGATVKNMAPYDENTIVVSTTDRGMLFLDQETGRETASFSLREGMPSVAVFDARVSTDGNLWTAGMRGLARLPADFPAFTNYTSKPNGDLPALLSEPSVNNVTAGIWLLRPDGSRDTVTLVGTMNGILIVPASGPPYTITKKEGLPMDLVMGAAQDRAGGIYLTSPSGVWYLHPPGVSHPYQPKSVALDGLSLGYRAEKVAFWPLFSPQPLRLPGGTRDLLWGAQDDRVMCHAGKGLIRIAGPETGFRGADIGTFHQSDEGLLNVVNSDGWFAPKTNHYSNDKL